MRPSYLLVAVCLYYVSGLWLNLVDYIGHRIVSRPHLKAEENPLCCQFLPAPQALHYYRSTLWIPPLTFSRDTLADTLHMHSSLPQSNYMPYASDSLRETNSNVDALLAIEPSIFRGVVHFDRPTLRTFYETYASDEYDRTPINVVRRNLALPERGDRVYYTAGEVVNTGTTTVEEDVPTFGHEDYSVQEQMLRSSDLSNVGGNSPREPMDPFNGLSEYLPRPTTPMEEFSDSDSDPDDEGVHRVNTCHGRRNRTPLPSLFLGCSDSEKEQCLAGLPEDTGSPLTDISDSDSSEGPLSPTCSHSGLSHLWDTSAQAVSPDQHANDMKDGLDPKLVSPRSMHSHRPFSIAPELYEDVSSSEESDGPLSPPPKSGMGEQSSRRRL